MQLKEKPELNQINEQSEFLARTYQPDRPIKEPKSVAKVDRTNLPPIKEPKSVTTTDIQPKEKLDLNQINQKLEVLVKIIDKICHPSNFVNLSQQSIDQICNPSKNVNLWQKLISHISIP